MTDRDGCVYLHQLYTNKQKENIMPHNPKELCGCFLWDNTHFGEP